MIRSRRDIVPYLFLVIPVIIYIVWVIGPMFYTFYLSLTDWDGLTTPNFIGLKNYVKLFDDKVFYISMANNLKWLLAFITIPVVFGLGLAMVLNVAIPGEKFFKMSFYMPMVLAMVVSGLIWGWMFHPSGGLINNFLVWTGLVEKGPGWLSDRDLVLWSIIGVAIWRQIGYVMVLYLAGLKSINPQLLEAAHVDGANQWNTFWKILLPLLTPVTIIVLVISVIDSLRAFDLVSVMTRGGPAHASSVLANFMYIEAFNNYKMGYGASIAVMLFFLSLIFIFVYLRRVMQDEMEY
ncbi:MAG: sugar ABC transporter permease [Anaerolineales bacterium]|nr:sugar ABC transporter permease [Chloroflexota bacterium]MBL6983175.1 sugar ABC transporter permease [Anaerolineales bacterium]